MPIDVFNTTGDDTHSQNTYGDDMGAVIGIAVMFFACYQAYINYQYFSAANDEYGDIGSKSKNLPNYGMRMWGWIALAVISALSSGVIGR